MNRCSRILVVDDEEFNRDVLEGMLESLGYESDLASNAPEGLEKFGGHIDLVLMDVMMPGMSGFEATQHLRAHPEFNDVPVVMVTALTSKEDRLKAVEAGANDFITKPIDRTELRVRVASLLKMKQAQDAIKRHRAELEDTVMLRTAELRQALQDLVGAQLDTLQRLAAAAEYRDEMTGAHIQRMSRYSEVIARGLGLPDAEVRLILLASPMHDVGKIGIPDAILSKPGRLTDAEMEIMKRHTTIGAGILSGSGSELLKAGEIIALTHHERWDGAGYPRGLAGEEIPLHGRICAVADVFDALTSERPYKRAFSNDEALEMMQAQRGTHFDPTLLDIFLINFRDILEIQATYRGK